MNSCWLEANLGCYSEYQVSQCYTVNTLSQERLKKMFQSLNVFSPLQGMYFYEFNLKLNLAKIYILKSYFLLFYYYYKQKLFYYKELNLDYLYLNLFNLNLKRMTHGLIPVYIYIRIYEYIHIYEICEH